MSVRGHDVASAAGKAAVKAGLGYLPQAPSQLPRLLPGQYELSFESVSVAVSGPWRLDWSLVDGGP